MEMPLSILRKTGAPDQIIHDRRIMQKKVSSAEYMKIRRYVLNRIYRANNKMIQLPTAQELATQFGCSRPTVSKAMKMLTDDGYVIGKPGIGSFTNPDRLGSGKGSRLHNLPIIGVIIADGMLVHYDIFFGTVLSQVLEQVINLPAILHIINLTSLEPETIARDILAEDLDGLIWQTSFPLAEGIVSRLRKADLPVVVLGDCAEPDADTFFFDADALGREMAELLLARKRKNVVLLADREPWNLFKHSLIKTYADAGCPLNEKLFLSEQDGSLDKLREFLEIGAPIDAVINPLFPPAEILDIFTSQGLNHTKDYTLINNENCPNSFVPGGIAYQFPIREEVAKAVRHLAGLLGKKPLPPPRCFRVPVPVGENALT